MTRCRICEEPTPLLGPDDHEQICAQCIEDAVLDAHLTAVEDTPSPIDRDGQPFSLAELRRMLDEAAGRPVAPLPDDIRADELAMLLVDSLDDDQLAGFMTELTPELGLASTTFTLDPSSPVEEPIVAPGMRHFRVLERAEIDGELRWVTRDIYRRMD